MYDPPKPLKCGMEVLPTADYANNVTTNILKRKEETQENDIPLELSEIIYDAILNEMDYNVG
jgi:hypothetical protein